MKKKHTYGANPMRGKTKKPRNANSMPSMQYIRLKVGKYDKKSTLSIQALIAASVSKPTQTEANALV